MIKALFVVALGAAGALQADRWIAALKGRMTARALTDGMIDGANRRLEKDRPGSG